MTKHFRIKPWILRLGLLSFALISVLYFGFLARSSSFQVQMQRFFVELSGGPQGQPVSRINWCFGRSRLGFSGQNAALSLSEADCLVETENLSVEDQKRFAPNRMATLLPAEANQAEIPILGDLQNNYFLVDGLPIRSKQMARQFKKWLHQD